MKTYIPPIARFIHLQDDSLLLQGSTPTIEVDDEEDVNESDKSNSRQRPWGDSPWRL